MLLLLALILVLLALVGGVALHPLAFLILLIALGVVIGHYARQRTY